MGDEDDRREPEPVPAESDPARELFDRLTAAAGRRRPRVDGRGRRRSSNQIHPDEQVWSAAGPSERDPISLASTVDAVVDSEGWRRTLDEVSLEPRWPSIVGQSIAEHTKPESLAGGVLTIRASSTSWATQVRLMARAVVASIAREVGDGVVTRIVVLGPTTPDWSHGPLRVRGGRGPRDTYG